MSAAQKPSGKISKERLAADPVFRGVTPARLKHWTLAVPLILALITTAAACVPDARDSAIERVLGPSDAIQSTGAAP